MKEIYEFVNVFVIAYWSFNKKRKLLKKTIQNKVVHVESKDILMIIETSKSYALIHFKRL